MPTFSFFSRFRSSDLVFSGVAVLFFAATASTQAQAPTFNVAEYAQYNEKIDDAAVSVAAKVAQRSAVASVPSARRSISAPKNVQNGPTSQNTTNAPTLTRRSVASSAPFDSRSNAPKSKTPKSKAAQIWEAFLFGTPNRVQSTPKFAFAQRDGALSSARAPRSLSLTAAQPARPTSPSQNARSIQPELNARSPQPLQSSQSFQPPQPLQSLQSFQPLPTSPIAQTNAPASDAEIAAARRRRLQELNAILAARRPEEFSRRLALDAAPSQALALVGNAESVESVENVDVANAGNAERPDADAPAIPLLVAESVRESDGAPFDAARANRSKIRQASNLEPAEPLELADDGFATFLLPTRPNALRLSPNVFLSTELVRLPSAAPLRELPESAPTTQSPQTAQPLPSAPTTQSVQTAQPLPSAPTTQSPQTAQPLPSAPTTQSPQTAQPLPSAPTTQSPQTAASTDVPTLRPTAQFVDPRLLPTRR